MALASEESQMALPARPVYIKNKRSSQALRTGVSIPTYTIQHNPPWLTEAQSTSPAPPSSFSDEGEGTSRQMAAPDVLSRDPTISYHPSYHAHPQQHIMDPGPQVRQSRLPIFKQVRSMLHKPPPLVTPSNARWDTLSSERGDSGKPSQATASTFMPPTARVNTMHKSSPERPPRPDMSDVSPVSILNVDEVKPPPPLRLYRSTPSPGVNSRGSSVSPVSPITQEAPTPLPSNQRSLPAPTPATPGLKPIKRKPTPSTISPIPQSDPVAPQQSPSVTSEWTEPPDEDDEQPNKPTSHFSWTTYAPSERPGRPSTDTTNTAAAKHVSRQSSVKAPAQPGSHFSWSTMNTGTTYIARTQSPPPSPPPPVPPHFTNPKDMDEPTKPRALPVQSILSRHRPVQRIEKEEWTPPPRNRSLGIGGTTPRSNSPQTATPRSTESSVHPAFRKESPFVRSPYAQTANGSSKRLPLPPALASPATPLSHLDSLLAQEKDLLLQRKNMQKAIAELEKIEKASPMEVSFAEVKDAKKKLEEHRKRLEEVLLEEREVGIAISRARRKEGEEEGLWVRRVTG